MRRWGSLFGCVGAECALSARVGSGDGECGCRRQGGAAEGPGEQVSLVRVNKLQLTRAGRGQERRPGCGRIP
jgi:hypothetical protein